MAAPGAEVVISGLSGRFPECDSVAEFRDKLFAGEHLVSCDRRRQDLESWGAPKYAAMLKNLDKFDAEFFGMKPGQVDGTDPQGRILLETVYEAIVDSGQNPQEMRGSRTGVFVGISFSDSEQYWSHQFEEENCSRYLLGNSDAMMANRISYVFNFKGPSAALDTGCSSSLYALEAAVASIADGRCDAAVVAATNVSLNPLLSTALLGAGALTRDGRCKVFDNSADGYTRAEAVVAVLLQRGADARRLYAEVVGTGTNCDGRTAHSIMFPSAEAQAALMAETCRRAGVDPLSMGYIEAHGTGTKVGDPQELRAIAEAYCGGRSSPLLVGSVKSNMGHAEAASGLCSLVKVVLAFETGLIPPNLHFAEPNRGVPQLLDGRIQVVSEKTPLRGDLAAINSFGFGGSNAHVILRRPAPRPSASVGDGSAAALVVASGRSEAAVRVLLRAVEEHGFDKNLVGLLHRVHDAETPGHPYRGFVSRTQSGRVNSVVQKFPETRRKVWFVFSGLGSQFSRMGAGLMGLPAFKDTIDHCARAVEYLGIDLHRVLCADYDFMESEFSTTFVAIVAMQLALLEVLKSFSVYPDVIVGHSLGEHAAGYADGCLSLEQAMLSAYHRGKVSDELAGSGGSMAVLGMSAAEAAAILPAGVAVACDNGEQQVTVSGAAAAVRQLVEAARRSGFAACEVQTRGVAFHGPAVRSAAEKLLAKLEQVIPEPRRRSDRWLSSSVPRCEWGSALAATCSANYLSRNYASPVLFYEACSSRASGDPAVLVEVAPHALLLSALRPSLGPGGIVLPLVGRSCDPMESLHGALGRLYVNGVPVRLAALFPDTQLPVRPGTAMLSPLVVWDHSRKWFVPSFSNKTSSKNIFSVDVNIPKYEWCRGHEIDGRILFPATGYLVIVWQTLAARKGIPQENLAVCFIDVFFHHATVLDDKGGCAELKVELLDSGLFEVRVADIVTASGKVSACDGADKEFVELPPRGAGVGGVVLDSADVYKLLRLRGYRYSGQFAGVLQLWESGGGIVRRNDNWIALLDTILQVMLLQDLSDSPGLHLPTKIRRLVIDPSKFKDAVSEGGAPAEQLPVRTSAELRAAECGGVQVCDVTTTVAPRRRDDPQPRTDPVHFVPHSGRAAAGAREALSLCLQVVAENLRGAATLRVVELPGGGDPLLPLVADVLAREPLVSARLRFAAGGDVPQATREALEAAGVDVVTGAPEDDDLVIFHDDPRSAVAAAAPEGFLLTLCLSDDVEGMSLVASFSLPDGARVSLFRKHVVKPRMQVLFQLKSDDQFQWVNDLKTALSNCKGSDMLIVVEGDSYTGIVGFVNCLRREPGIPFIRYVAVLDASAPSFALDEPPYRDQLSLGLVSNVLVDGTWGSFRLLEPRGHDDDDDAVTTEHARVDISRPGHLNSLRWIQAADPHCRDKKGTLVNVCYSALNFRDIMIATGRLPEASYVGYLQLFGSSTEMAKLIKDANFKDPLG